MRSFGMCFNLLGCLDVGILHSGMRRNFVGELFQGDQKVSKGLFLFLEVMKET
jgi:hypothetical protein